MKKWRVAGLMLCPNRRQADGSGDGTHAAGINSIAGCRSKREEIVGGWR